MRIRLVKKFLEDESSSSLLLLVSAIVSLLWANSPFSFLHYRFIDMFLFWINEGLMALFFLLIGLELKHGYITGHLTRLSQILLPLIAALGGMIVPACVYIVINYHSPRTLIGWPIPVATDIAFALGALAVFGKRVPTGLKVFLMALAIFDDIGAICIITFFHTDHLSLIALLWPFSCVLILYFLNDFNIKYLFPYIIVGICLWLSLLPTGIHPTLAGVILAFFIPNTSARGESLLLNLKEKLNPVVAFFIIPLFALANAGFSLDNVAIDIFNDVVILGIIFGLFIGKQVGVFGVSWLLIKLKFSKLPASTTWLQMYGVALLCGIGFTMSLFLGTLSFHNEPIYLSKVRLGVMCGSIISAIVGMLVLKVAFERDRS